MANTTQSDYDRFPKHMHGGPVMAAHIAKYAARGTYDLLPNEILWRDLQPFLLTKGYRLRPRYEPGWSAPWIGTDVSPNYFEESRHSVLPNVIDARRVSDDALVAIKWIPDAEHTRDEIDIMRFLTSPEMLQDPDNHCVPLLTTFTNPDMPDGVFTVTPWLADLHGVPLENVNDVVDMMLQTLSGLAFLHRHNVAHRDCTGWNIMQDVSSMFFDRRNHPMNPAFSEDMQELLPCRSRAESRVRYYFIDFGISTRFSGPGPHLVTGEIGRDPSAPELSDVIPYDPFKLDVYLLGNYFLNSVLAKYINLEFLRPLLLEMTRPNPLDRPTAAEALRRLHAVAREPSTISFGWYLIQRNYTYPQRVIFGAACLARQCAMHVRSCIRGSNALSFGRRLP
ncbi:hypothetical protein EXIGLDRAFT_846440 [Exidia glandulosa HHB12029]|uniref:Protein kinase domain-containing protein n=1 Tax=Exidia glandulosa HHB12029 TaxID=1314781 RepID=A0A165AY09_EXIGL|nr:hypothetical protein EXIGLDRAFT_846440 [Exidia glandulosa HHB12029]